MNKIKRIMTVIWWLWTIRKDVDKVIVYQVPNLVSQTPSRVFPVSDKYFEYDYSHEDRF